MAIKTSCLSHPPRAKIVLIREEFLTITDGHHCAAALLAVMEYWTNWKLDHIARQIEEFDELGKDTALIEREPWIYKNNQSFQEDLMGLFGRNKVLDGLARLIDAHYLKRRKNPGVGWDRTYQYLLDIEKVQQAINDLERFKIKPQGYKQTELSGLNLNRTESQIKPNGVPSQTPSGLNLNRTESQIKPDGVPNQTPFSLKKDEQYQRIQTETITEDTRETTTREPQTSAAVVHLNNLKKVALTDDQVLIPHPNQDNLYHIESLHKIVKHDIRAAGVYDELHLYTCRSEVFYSIVHALGEGDEQWTEEETRKIRERERLERELGERWNRLGAFSLGEALHKYFSSDLVARFLNNTPEELERIETWLAHTRHAHGLKNPAGFLRSKIESGDQAP
jgi:hypothetical protein